MQVTVGPIPEDSSRIIPSRDIAGAISGTTITGFGQQAFVSSLFNFLISQTDPPSTVSERALLWYRRGEGTHYYLDTRPPLSGVSDPNFVSNWVAISNRREITAQYNYAVVTTNATNIIDNGITRGDLLQIFPHRGGDILRAARVGTNCRMTLRLSRTAGAWKPFPPFFLAGTDGSNGQHLPVVHFGYAYARLASGASAPGHGVVRVSEANPWIQTSVQPFSTSECYCAHIVESRPSITEGQLVRVFLPPMAYNLLA